MQIGHRAAKKVAERPSPAAMSTVGSLPLSFSLSVIIDRAAN